jgi:DNA-binding transcriptional MerR regulator
MSIKIHGKTYYRTSETAQLAGISRSTLLRWLDNGIIKDTSRRDRRGWRLFTEDEIEILKAESSQVVEE